MYRVNALREMFEETGVLLYRRCDELTDTRYPVKAKMHDMDSAASAVEWREKVLADPFEFETLFRRLRCVPDILSLVPWARLQTPWRTGRRWDARFYLALIDAADVASELVTPLGREIVAIDWLRIDAQMGETETESGKWRFPPPTLMKLKELHVICNREGALQSEYARAYLCRCVRAIRPKMAVCAASKRPVILWNRDYMYAQLDLEPVDCNAEFEREGKNLHRLMIGGEGRMQTVSSFDRMYEYKTTATQHIPSKL